MLEYSYKLQVGKYKALTQGCCVHHIYGTRITCPAATGTVVCATRRYGPIQHRQAIRDGVSAANAYRDKERCRQASVGV